VNKVELEILPRGDVRDTVGILLRQLGHHLELLWIESSERHLDAQHAGSVPHRAGPLGRLVGERELAALGAIVALAVVVALAVGAAAKAGLGEDLFVDLALLAQPDLGLELIDLGRELLRDFAAQAFFPDGVTGFHKIG
jgi:hypothetical protein